MMLQPNALMVHAHQAQALALDPQHALVVNPSAQTAHAPTTVLVSTKSVAATTKSNVPTDNVLILPSPLALLPHAQAATPAKCLNGLCTTSLSNCAFSYCSRRLQRLRWKPPRKLLFLALMVLALLLLNNADLSYHAKHSSLDALMVHADQLFLNAHRLRPAPLSRSYRCPSPVSALKALTTAHLLLMVAQLFTEEDAR